MKRPPKWTGIGFIKLQRITEQARAKGLAHHLNNARYEPDGTAVRITARNGNSFLVDPETAQIIDDAPGPQPVQYAKAADAVKAINAAVSADEVAAILNGELLRDTPRKSVVEAANARLDEFA